VLLALAAAAALALSYWLLRVTEGAYLGARTVRWLYDRGADTYDGIKGFRRDEEVGALGNPLLSRIEESAGTSATVLDVATGTCRLPLALLDIPFFQGAVVGLDISRRMLEVGAGKTERWRDRLHLVHHAAVPLPFADASFDAVTLLEALEFLPDRSAALQEMARVVRPGGWILVTNRIGTDARLMPGKVDAPERFEQRLRELGLVEVRTQPWQSFYALVWARKPAAQQARLDSTAHRTADWHASLVCPTCEAVGRWVSAVDNLSCAACGCIVRCDERVWLLTGDRDRHVGTLGVAGVASVAPSRATKQ
jgi:ubiquinone/menaquinone biosynthesis C-methylase UbiE